MRCPGNSNHECEALHDINHDLPRQSNIMKATQLLHNRGQSIWLDNITRDLLNQGAKAFVKSWNDLLGVIASKSAALQRAAWLRILAVIYDEEPTS